jgi:hypothetical protein
MQQGRKHPREWDQLQSKFRCVRLVRCLAYNQYALLQWTKLIARYLFLHSHRLGYLIEFQPRETTFLPPRKRVHHLPTQLDIQNGQSVLTQDMSFGS